MTSRLERLLLCMMLLSWIPAAAMAGHAQPPQSSTTQPGAVRLFFDCPQACDETFLRSEITFVDYMRDRRDADVHVLVTTQGTGGGGTEFTLKFMGLGRFAGVNQTLTYVSAQTATPDERRRGLAETLKQGLVRYASETPIAPRLKVTFTPEPGKEGQSDPANDPWNLWVFNASAGGGINGEESSGSRSIRGSLSANRTTDDWKLSFSARTDYRESRFELSDGETFRTVSRNMDTGALTVKSLGPHWSAALVGNASVSSFLNQDFRARVAPGIEYNLFPYAENTRRRLTFQYTIGVSRFNYDEETVFGKLTETLPDHKLRTTLSMTQPWGSAFASVNFSQYLTKPDKYSLSTFGEASVRLFKGFSLEAFGEVARTRDQLYLQRGTATTEEILVQQRQLLTGYQYFVNFGISYSFGSIFNNVVNPRFDGF
jgi:hypothetical protein